MNAASVEIGTCVTSNNFEQVQTGNHGNKDVNKLCKRPQGTPGEF